jgi:hypothetical protein
VPELLVDLVAVVAVSQAPMLRGTQQIQLGKAKLVALVIGIHKL